VEYSNQDFTIQGAGCGDANSIPYVAFDGQSERPQVTDPNVTVLGTDPTGTWDISLGCGVGEINFNGQAASFSGQPGPEACEAQISSSPLGGPYNFKQLAPGMQFCLLGAEGDNLVYVKLLTVSDNSYTTTWAATGWAIPGST
jgi:hypothetical protein